MLGDSPAVLAPSGERIGSLVLWRDGRTDDVNLADMHAIAHDLRGVVERSCWRWEPWHDDPDRGCDGGGWR